jgi:hypothetical protein
MECRQAGNRKRCPCTYDCAKKGVCCECIREHLADDELPACCFSKKAEATYDRSFAAFARDKGLV